MSAIPELIAYIRKETKEGVAAEDLRVALMEAGWNERDIENALHDVAAGLQSVTYGASIHEDLAQVRGMVAHLAGRMKTLEARLSSSSELPLPAAVLPSGTIGPERELPRGHLPRRQAGGPSLLVKIISGFADVLVLGFAGWYLAQRVAESNAAPTGLLWTGAVVGAVLLAFGYYFMRARKPWVADLAAASSVALWSIIVWHAWQTYHLLEHQTAVGLYVLLFVLLVVMGRWIDRLSR